MLKQFLNFIGGNSGDSETLEDGYLESKLEDVEPRVIEALEECSAHDPLLLVAVEVLREACGPRWAEAEVECPVSDAQSPGQESPPPPPGVGPTPDTRDLTEEARKAREEQTARDEPDGSNGGATEGATEGAADEGQDEEEPASPDLSDEGSPGLTDPSGDGLAIESSVEVGPDGVDEAAEADGEDVGLDSEPVLQVARVFLGVLAENDRLPLELQMSAADIGRARDLLLAYFLEDGRVQVRAQELLEVVEQKFNQGLFSQAEILLQLFETDEATLIENDRNLFYEEMILRYGVQRRHDLGAEAREAFETRVEQTDGADEGAEELFDWLAQGARVSLNVRGRDRQESERWRETAEKSRRQDVGDYFLEVIPPSRWRRPSTFEQSFDELIGEQIDADYARTYVTHQIKTCYFILRAVGDTGMEPFLHAFFGWTEEVFDVDATALMPELYEETTANERLMDDIFDEIYETHFSEPVEAVVDQWDRQAVEEAADGAVATIGEVDPNIMPPGHYDFGGFVVDELLGRDYHDEAFAFQLHRLT